MDTLIVNSAGAALIGTVIATLLCGIATALVVGYLRAWPQDRLAYRALAVSMAVISFTNTAINWLYAYEALVINYGNLLFYDSLSWKIVSGFVFMAVAALELNCLLGFRVYTLSGRSRKWLVVVGFALSISATSLAVSIYMTWWASGLGDFTGLLKKRSMWLLWLILHLVSEAIMTSALVYWVIWVPHRTRSRTTTDVKQPVVLRAIEANAMGVAVLVAAVVLFQESERAGLWFSSVSFSICSLYTVSLCLALISRIANEATFAYESEAGGVRVTRLVQVGPSSVVAKVEVEVHDDVHLDAPTAHNVALDASVGYRRPMINYGSEKRWDNSLDPDQF